MSGSDSIHHSINSLTLTGQLGEVSKTPEERSLALVEKVQEAGTHVMFENKEVVAWTIQNNQRLKNKVIEIHIKSNFLFHF